MSRLRTVRLRRAVWPISMLRILAALPGAARYARSMDVRRLTAGEGERIRDLRLRALKDAPYAFSSSFERERDRGADAWEELAAGGVVFVAVEDADWLGMVGAFLPEHAPEAVGIW